MKRIKGIFDKICSLENIEAAYNMAKRGKGHYRQVKMIEENPTYHFNEIRLSLINKTFNTGEYIIEKITDNGKEREIYKLPFYPDRIVHWAIMLQIEDPLTKTFIRDSFGSIKGRGVHDGLKRMSEKVRSNIEENQYCLKIDIKKFFPSIDQSIMKKIYRKKFKESSLLWLLDNIVDSISGRLGLAIGNYISQYLSNLYLTYFDHWVKQILKIKNYFRYVDDMVFFGKCKNFLHLTLRKIQKYLKTQLNLTLKKNYQLFPTFVRGVDFLGYRLFEKHILLRKRTKQKLKRVSKYLLNNLESDSFHNVFGAYLGQLIHCNGGHLYKKFLKPVLQRKEALNAIDRIRMESNR